jgi:hypothetical protein
MKKSILFCCLFSSQVFAIQIKIIGPCSENPTNTSKNIIAKNLPATIGSISVEYFTKENIPFTGSIEGINSINNSAVGDDALEVISDTKMRAYGWCYKLNDELVNKMPDAAFLTKNADYITWFYAYAEYDSGTWTKYCSPAYLIKPTIFCSK